MHLRSPTIPRFYEHVMMSLQPLVERDSCLKVISPLLFENAVTLRTIAFTMSSTRQCKLSWRSAASKHLGGLPLDSQIGNKSVFILRGKITIFRLGFVIHRGQRSIWPVLLLPLGPTLQMSLKRVTFFFSHERIMVHNRSSKKQAHWKC